MTRSEYREVDPPSQRLSPWQCVMLFLSVYVLVALGTEALYPITAETREIIEVTDFWICMVFIGDFFYRFACARNRMSFFLRNWIDLVASIPAIDLFRVGRLARVMRILRLLRAFRSMRHVVAFVYMNRAQSTFASVAMISFVVWFFSAVSIIHCEVGVPGANIANAGDAMWWAFVTITTVGYGDRYPVTHEGRVIACMLMTAGVGLFGTFTGFIASVFVSPASNAPAPVSADTELRAEIAQLRVAIEELRASNKEPRN